MTGSRAGRSGGKGKYVRMVASQHFGEGGESGEGARGAGWGGTRSSGHRSMAIRRGAAGGGNSGFQGKGLGMEDKKMPIRAQIDKILGGGQGGERYLDILRAKYPRGSASGYHFSETPSRADLKQQGTAQKSGFFETNKMPRKTRDRAQPHLTNASSMKQSTCSNFNIGVMGSHYDTLNPTDPFTSIEHLFPYETHKSFQNLMLFKSASLFTTKTLLYTSANLEIEVKSCLYNSNNSEAIKLTLCYIYKGPSPKLY